MKIGFTGTREGMTVQQIQQVTHLLVNNDFDEAHMGDCIGADTQFYHLVHCVGKGKTIGHPPENGTLRSYLKYFHEEAPKTYLERNKDIVRVSDLVIACPGQQFEIQRSGTWSTIRFAKSQGTPLIVITPDGCPNYFLTK